MAKAPQFKNVSIKQIRKAKYNPSHRSKSRIRQLSRSIAKVGLMYPLLVDESNNLIDGHRRLEACVQNGWETVPCLVVSGDRHEMYHELNANSKKMSGRENLGVFLAEPMAVPPKLRAYLTEMVEVIGEDLAVTMYNHGFSAFAYRIAKEVCQACGKETPNWIKLVIQWFMTCESFGYVKDLLNSKVISPAIVLRHAKQRRPLKMKVV